MPAATASPETGFPSKVVLLFVQVLGFRVQGLGILIYHLGVQRAYTGYIMAIQGLYRII